MVSRNHYHGRNDTAANTNNITIQQPMNVSDKSKQGGIYGLE